MTTHRLQNPPFLAACPTCHAPAGSSCIRPSEHRTKQPHRGRMDRVDYLLPCPVCKARAGQACPGRRDDYHRERGRAILAYLCSGEGRAIR